MEHTQSQSKPVRRRQWLAKLVLLCAVLLALFLWRAPLLNWVARAWMVNDPPAKADALVVLGGGANFRSFEAARLYHSGWAPRVLVMNSELRATDRLGLTIPEAELVRRILLSNAVPPEAIQVIGTNLTSTHDEAMTLRQWSEDSHAGSFLIPTGPFHSRRARWVLQKAFRGLSARFTVTSIAPAQCRDWWKKEKSLIDFETEAVKFGFYLVKY